MALRNDVRLKRLAKFIDRAGWWNPGWRNTGTRQRVTISSESGWVFRKRAERCELVKCDSLGISLLSVDWSIVKRTSPNKA